MRAALLLVLVLTTVDARAQGENAPARAFGSGDERTEAVLSMTVPFAIRMLDEQGGFAPFGLGSASEEAALIPVHLAEEGVSIPEVANRTVLVLRQIAEDGLPEAIRAQSPNAVLEAAVVCMDTYTDVPGRGRTEAVVAVVEARDVPAMTYVQPYVREPEGIRYLDAYIVGSAPMIFVE